VTDTLISQNYQKEIASLKSRDKLLLEITSLLTSAKSLDSLLETIVSSLCNVTNSDAGSLYILEGKEKLKFAVALNKSKSIPFKSFTLKISKENIAGYVVLTGAPISFDDVYLIPADSPYKFNSEFDKKFNYKTKSMVTIPMKNRIGKVVGVVQLINKKRDSSILLNSVKDTEQNVISFSEADIEFITLLASQAAIAIERQSLYDGIERLLRGIVESSAKSIESRDKVTGGHSQRIAAYMVVLAKRISKCNEGIFKDKHFSSEEIKELFIAAMLHDIGKIGVREYLLNKQNKLTDNRMKVIRKRIEMQIMHEPSRKEEWEENMKFIKEINTPTYLDDARFKKLMELKEVKVKNYKNEDEPLLMDFELENLSIRKGNLTEAERKQIEMHVAHSESILSTIPWTEDLSKVPLIAGTHHEKLNGKGYPKGLKGNEIPFGGKMLAVVDIFEALTALDRPYKRAMSIEKALEIIRVEAKNGALDSDIIEFFIHYKCYDVITDEMRKKFTLTAEEILALE